MLLMAFRKEKLGEHNFFFLRKVKFRRTQNCTHNLDDSIVFIYLFCDCNYFLDIYMCVCVCVNLCQTSHLNEYANYTCMRIH